MVPVIRVRDVVHGETYDVDAGLRAMRVPYEMIDPDGAVRQHADLIEWDENSVARSARFAEARLDECTEGERVLLHLPLPQSENEWWLCEIESIDVDGNE